ncbi:hypothetical protein N7466_006437 [Penicillium verhagenii]|uniref:uncharacterized protein n=1 Tax=Penicillium verhagenii TaxID=1562060 RepID=UPI002545071A|nr:uncharacterized protein N7466_006437 [Penicillium verhagenii]KAJ5930944.1 hypothetical protein N7466_006437 [Penicillium verhagenii]
MSLLTLPPELKMAIVQYLPSMCDIVSLAGICQDLYDFLMPEVYRLSFQRNGAETLDWAAKNGHSRVVEDFLKDNGYPGRMELQPHMNRALELSVQFGQTCVVETLLPMEGVDPDHVSSRLDRTPLSHAAEKAYVDIVRVLLETNRVDPNSKDPKYRHPPLIWAVRDPKESSISVIQLLLEYGARIDFLDSDARNVLFWAITGGLGSSTIVRFLLQKGARPDGNVDEEQQIIVKSRDGTSRIEFKNQRFPFLGDRIILPLSLAASMGYDEVVQTLLEFNANINCPSISGILPTRHPLSCAAENGHLSTVHLLMNRGACPESPGRPLYYAVSNGHVKVVRLLLDEMIHHCSRITDGGNTDACSKKGKHNPGRRATYTIEAAVKSKNFEVVKLLLAFPGVYIDYKLLELLLVTALEQNPPNFEMIEAILAEKGLQGRINWYQNWEGNSTRTWLDQFESDDIAIQHLMGNVVQGLHEPPDVPINWQVHDESPRRPLEITGWGWTHRTPSPDQSEQTGWMGWTPPLHQADFWTEWPFA